MKLATLAPFNFVKSMYCKTNTLCLLFQHRCRSPQMKMKLWKRLAIHMDLFSPTHHTIPIVNNSCVCMCAQNKHFHIFGFVWSKRSPKCEYNTFSLLNITYTKLSLVTHIHIQLNMPLTMIYSWKYTEEQYDLVHVPKIVFNCHESCGWRNIIHCGISIMHDIYIVDLSLRLNII